jgi:hypothetical protein
MRQPGDRPFRRRRFGLASRRLGRIGSRPVRLARKEFAMETQPASSAVIRDELVDRVRKEIEAGGYDSAEKLEAAFDRLVARHFAE